MNTEQLLPPGVADEEKITAGGLTVSEIQTLEDWKSYEGLMPPEIVALSVRQRGKKTSDGGDYEAEALLPAGVV